MRLVDDYGNPVDSLSNDDFDVNVDEVANKKTASQAVLNTSAITVSAVLETDVPGTYVFAVTYDQISTLNVQVVADGIELNATAEILFILDPSKLASVSGRVWRDANVNGTADAGEPSLAEWKLYLDLNQNGLYDADEPVTWSDVNGLYMFAELKAGTYHVGQVIQSGWQQTYPSGDELYRLNLAEGEHVTANFGNATDADVAATIPPEFASVSGNIWYDYSEDGRRYHAEHSAETALSGWTVTLTGQTMAGVPVSKQTMSTDDGGYVFADVPRGHYAVRREHRSHWVGAYPFTETHHIMVDWGFDGLLAANRVVVAGNEPGWLNGLRAGKGAMYAGATLVLDTDDDGQADRTVYVSGGVSISWTAAQAQQAEYTLDKFSLHGHDEVLGSIELHSRTTSRASGVLGAAASDSLANSELRFAFAMNVDGQTWSLSGLNTPVLTGQVAQMLPYNQSHTMDSDPAVLMDVFGRFGARVLNMTFTPLYGVDFGVNQSVFGSAPAERYAVTLDDNGARHVVHPNSEERLVLGSGIDEAQLFVRRRVQTQPPAVRVESLSSGVSPDTEFRAGEAASLTVHSSGSGFVHAWLDFDGDGTWSVDEKITAQAVTSGANVVSFTLPETAQSGTTWLRVRLYAHEGDVASTGAVSGGEVEDYAVEILEAENEEEVATHLGDRSDTPLTFSLDANYPNPFNPGTNIRYSLAESGSVQLAVYDVGGRHVRTLVDAHQSKGVYLVPFDASGLSSGVYLYRLVAGGQVFHGKMTLLK